jgi:hypothetical protein
MKTIRRVTILAGFSLLFPALAVTVARAQSIAASEFNGSFTLPFEVQWGNMILPAGDYTLNYGRLIDRAGAHAVAIAGEAEGSPRGTLLVQGRSQASATKNALVCAREGDTVIVRALELPAIGEATSFGTPHGVELLARKKTPKAKAQIAEARMPVVRVTITPSGK